MVIPNKLQFDLDLQDLPVRATQLAPESLGLSGKYTCSYFINKGNRSNCGEACNRYGRNNNAYAVAPQSTYKYCQCRHMVVSQGNCY